MSPVTICWFKRDLRVHDHAALHFAAQHGRVLPLYIVEPELWQQPDASGRQYEFVQDCLADLRDDLESIGLCLTIRVGAATDVLETLRREQNVTLLTSHEET